MLLLLPSALTGYGLNTFKFGLCQPFNTQQMEWKKNRVSIYFNCYLEQAVMFARARVHCGNRYTGLDHDFNLTLIE